MTIPNLVKQPNYTKLLGQWGDIGYELWPINQTTLALMYQGEIIDFVAMRMPVDKIQARVRLHSESLA